jgi:uncharacterized protein with gpF-like domain
VVAEGVKAGLSEKEIAKAIRNMAPGKSASRAQTIARTEVHGAAMFTAQVSAESTGIDFRREWVSSDSERSREAHQNVDGPVSMSEPFIVGGEALMYPGDPNGSPGNVINCRCVVTFTV